MKLTTKIVFGIIISIFLLSFSVIIFVSFLNIENSDIDVVPIISQENIIPVKIEPYKTIFIDEVQNQNSYNLYPSGTFLFKPVINDGEKNKLFLPEELLQFTEIISSNDTLIIRLKMDELNEKYSIAEKRVGMFYHFDCIKFFIHSNTVDIINNFSGVKIEIKNINTDKIKIHSFGDINIDSCQVDMIKPIVMSRWKSFSITNSKVKELNIDLDNIGKSWQIENCDIEVENLTGNGNHKVNLPKSEAKIINWIPKDKEAELTIKLFGDTAKITFP